VEDRRGRKVRPPHGVHPIAVFRGPRPAALRGRGDRRALDAAAHRPEREGVATGASLLAGSRNRPALTGQFRRRGPYNAPQSMSTLVVQLPLAAPTGAIEWAYALTVDGQSLVDQGQAPAALLPQPRGTGA